MNSARLCARRCATAYRARGRFQQLGDRAAAQRNRAAGRLQRSGHRVLRNPSLRYISHISAPGLDAIGANEPFLPGVSVGRQQSCVAFGLTIFYIDQEDVCV